IPGAAKAKNDLTVALDMRSIANTTTEI
ncbi:unnamed protein product, partial [Rotaria socialis]